MGRVKRRLADCGTAEAELQPSRGVWAQLYEDDDDRRDGRDEMACKRYRDLFRQRVSQPLLPRHSDPGREWCGSSKVSVGARNRYRC